MREILQRLAGFLSSFWRGVDRARRLVVNLLFLAIVVFVLAWLLEDDTPEVPDSAALVVAPYGSLVEELTDDSDEMTVLAILGEKRPETLLRSLLEAIDTAKDDGRIQALVLDTDRLAGAGLSKLQSLRAAIEDFKESGKPVLAAADFYTQNQYYLASMADEIHLHPMGTALVTGYGSYRNYYKEALDKFAVDWHVFRVGEYKSAVEPYLRQDMSPEARESRQRWLSILWQEYTDDVESARGLRQGALGRYASSFDELLKIHQGDAAAAALAEGLVDRLSYRDEVRQRLIELVGADEEGTSFSRIGHEDYLLATDGPTRKSEHEIAVVVARGSIQDGRRGPGRTGGDSTAQLIRQVREDDDIEALVLRVDSPGGSAFASEIIRRELDLTRQAGKPVIVSMSSVAASGGYWISMAADEIWAQSTTITGSIGIYAMFPTYPRTLQELGIQNDGVGTGPLAGTLRADRPLPSEAQRALELMIGRGYTEFIDLVATNRQMTRDEVDALARGRVWAGRDALELGLIDRLGGLPEALEAAAGRAGLGEDYRVTYLRQKISWRTRILERLIDGWLAAVGAVPGLETLQHLQEGALPPLTDALQPPAGFGDPNDLFAYCFCEPH